MYTNQDNPSKQGSYKGRNSPIELISEAAWNTVSSKPKKIKVTIEDILNAVDSYKCNLIQPKRSRLESLYDDCAELDLETLSKLQNDIRHEFAKISNYVQHTEEALSLIEQKLMRQHNVKSNIIIFKKISTQVREARQKKKLLYIHMNIISERCAISRQTLDADRRTQDDLFALIENKRREFHTEVNQQTSIQGSYSF